MDDTVFGVRADGGFQRGGSGDDLPEAKEATTQLPCFAQEEGSTFGRIKFGRDEDDSGRMPDDW